MDEGKDDHQRSVSLASSVFSAPSVHSTEEDTKIRAVLPRTKAAIPVMLPYKGWPLLPAEFIHMDTFFSSQKQVYWWNDKTAETKSDCIKLKRTCTRLRRKLYRKAASNDEDGIAALTAAVVTAKENFRQKRKEYKKETNKAKKEEWDNILRTVEEDPEGRSYQVVVGTVRCGRVVCPKVSSTNKAQEDASSAGETHQVKGTDDSADSEQENEITEFEIQQAVKEAMSKKEPPGPDGIWATICKEVSQITPRLFIKVINACLEESTFLKIWKRTKLTLVLECTHWEAISLNIGWPRKRNKPIEWLLRRKPDWETVEGFTYIIFLKKSEWMRLGVIPRRKNDSKEEENDEVDEETTVVDDSHNSTREESN